MPQDVENYAIDLEGAPECARRIAIVLGLFVQIEHGLVAILRWAADMSPDQARVALEMQKQNSRKMTFLQRMCEGISPGWPRDVEAGKLFAEASQIANQIRNKYAHGSYSRPEGADPEVLYVGIFAQSASSAARVEIITPEFLDAEIRFLKSLIVAMSNYAEARAAGSPVNVPEIQGVVANVPRPVLHKP